MEQGLHTQESLADGKKSRPMLQGQQADSRDAGKPGNQANGWVQSRSVTRRVALVHVDKCGQKKWG